MHCEELTKLLEEYQETEKSIYMALEFVDDKDYGKGKLEVVQMIIRDLQRLIKLES